MPQKHSPHMLSAFPAYSSGFLDDTHLVLGGGGGAARTGILNKLRVYSVGSDRNLNLVDELELARGEDAPMSMATSPEDGTLACGVNSPMEQMAKGENENCRVYAFKDQKLALVRSHGTLNSGDAEDYQKVTVLSPDATLLAVAGTNSFQLLAYPALTPLAGAITTEKEIYDATFSKTTLVVATTANLLVYALPTPETKPSPSKNKKKGKQKVAVLSELELLQTLAPPVGLSRISATTFRAARFHPANSDILYTISNTVPARSRTRKPAPTQAYICKWNTTSWTSDKVKKVCDKSITCFRTSPDGKLLAYGDQGLSVGLLDSMSLSPLATILKAHDQFASTTLAFNQTATLLVSASADNSVRVISVPESIAKSSWSVVLFIILALFMAILAFAAQQYT
ncbi:WD-REPEATS-REGION domain-containing protein [Mycena kentingensis (nom. inval.)]|nr:WD-REPEATS-REGION domain-containing protein [Mycena kentingensis (nom. inval.)]